MYVLFYKTEKKLKFFIQTFFINISFIFLVQSEAVNTTLEIIANNETTTLPPTDVVIQS